MMKQLFLYVNGLSDLGSRMDLIAFSALIFTFDNSPFWLMAFFLARQIGGILSSFYAGVLADRLDRRSLMMASDVISGLAVVAVLLFPHPYVMVTSALLKGMLYSVFHVSFAASIPQIFGEQNALRVNSLVVRLESVAGIAGFVIGGVLADRFGYQFVIGFDAATFFLSAIALLWVRWNRDPRQSGDKHSGKNPSLRRDIADVCKYLKLHPVFMIVSALLLFFALSMSGYNYGLPILSDELVNGNSTVHGMMWAIVSIGSLVGSVVAARFQVKLLPALMYATLAWSLLIMLAFAVTQLILILLLLFFVGLFEAAIRLYDRTIMQKSDNHIRGRILGVQSLLSRIGFLIGFFVAPFFTAAISLQGMVTILQLCSIAAVFVCSFLWWRKPTRDEQEKHRD